MTEQWWHVALIFGAPTAVGLLAGWLSGFLMRRVARRRRYQRFLTQLHRSCHRPWVAVLVL
jgi:hypothetical protein